MTHYEELYLKKKGDLVPLMEIMSNETFAKNFKCNTDALYKYCLEHDKTREEVLQVEIKEEKYLVY